MESIDYTKLSKSRMTDQFRFDEAFLALMDTLITHRSLRQAQYQEFAEVFLDIDKSKGKALDAIGKVVGQERRLVNFIQQPYFGFKGARFAEAYDVGYWYSMNKARLGTLKVVNDDQYRRLIKARIINNRSRCTRNDLLSILNILTGNNQSMIYEVSHGVFQVSVAEGDEGLASYFLSRYREPNTMFSIPLGYRMTIRYKDVVPPISCAGATNTIDVVFSAWVNHTPTDQWNFSIRDLTTNEVYVSFTNNQYDLNLQWHDICEQQKTANCPFDFSVSNSPNLSKMVLKAGVDRPVRVRLDGHRLPTATDTEVIRFDVGAGNPAYTVVSDADDNCIVDVCFEYTPVQISCDSATAIAELPNDPDSTASSLITSVVLNGVDYPLNPTTGLFDLPPNTVTLNFKRRQKPSEGGGSHWGYYIEVASISDDFMRVELIGYRNDIIDDYWDGSQNSNPTLAFDEATPKAVMCLSPDLNQITCDGAEPSVEMAFAIKDGETPTLDVIFLVDNETVDLMNNPPPYITREVLNKVYDGSVPAGFSTGNGVLKFTNTDSIPHRIEAFTNNFQNIRIVANHNPTVIEFDSEFVGADVGVCLLANV